VLLRADNQTRANSHNHSTLINEKQERASKPECDILTILQLHSAVVATAAGGRLRATSYAVLHNPIGGSAWQRIGCSCLLI